MFAITASKEEYDSYIALATENAAVSKIYLAYFGDIYLSNPRLLPEFDVSDDVPSQRILASEHRQPRIWRDAPIAACST